MRGVVEMRFKVGDKVRVLENLTLEDVGQVHDMLEFEGLEATVETVFDQSYHLTVDNHEWYWMDELLEPVEEELEMSTVKFDIPEWVNWLARDKTGALYGYREKPTKCFGMWGVTGDDYDFEEVVVSFITEDPSHYPQVKWEDEEPKPFKDGITVVDFGNDGLLDFHTTQAITALQSFGNTLTDNEKLRWGLKTVNQIREGEDNVEPNPETITEPDMVNTPPHYKQYSFEPIDIITEVVKEYPPEIGFHIGTTLKYLFRSPFKGKQQEDLAKAEYYLQRANKELGEVQ